MTSTTSDYDASAGQPTSIGDVRSGLGAALCTATVFVSAALVFLVEPMIAKLVLPKLGGSPAVWNTCLAFFQAALLVGYAYAHLLQCVGSFRAQVAIHAAAMLAAAAVLPLQVSDLLGEPRPDAPVVWLLAALTLSVGAPFAVLSATAPLIQAWYARAYSQKAGQAYALYAASNFGSLLALLAYPVAVEPSLSLDSQTRGWSLGFAAFILLIGAAALAIGPRIGKDRTAAATAVSDSTSRIGWRTRLMWVTLAAIPSSLMLGVTSHLSSDIAAAPMLWVAPLAIYLATFIIAFRTKPLLSRESTLIVGAATFEACLLTIGMPVQPVLLQAALELAGFFFAALICHQALAARRPAERHLTEFYLLTSVGGVLGGGFNAFLAPTLFRTVVEYPLALGLSVLGRPWTTGRLGRKDWAWLVVGCAGGIVALGVAHVPSLAVVTKTMVVATFVAAFMVRDRSLPFLALSAVVFLVGQTLTQRQPTQWVDRSFFGIVRLMQADVPGFGQARLMMHGTTLHGAELLDPAERCRPLLYYAPTTPIGQVFHTVLAARPNADIGVIGMGTGSVAAYTRPGDHLRFFEIDPLVARVAEDPANFGYIHGCAGGSVDHVLGDARLTLAREPDDRFDILLVDAFSSDSIPAHLLTVEAMRGYLRHVKPNGVVVMHLSNTNLELMRPVAGAAAAAGATALQQAYRPPAGAIATIDTAEDAIIVARAPQALASFAADPRWRSADPKGVSSWTDDYTNLFGALMRGFGHVARETQE